MYCGHGISASFAANHLFLCLFAWDLIDAIIFGDKRACTTPDTKSLAIVCWNKFAAKLLHQRVSENKQTLISIINQVHMEVLHLFLVDKDKLLVVVAELQFWLACYGTLHTLFHANVIQDFYYLSYDIWNIFYWDLTHWHKLYIGQVVFK